MNYAKLYQNIHLPEVQLLIKKDNHLKAGIYMLLNKINNNKIIGSAGTNRLYSNFRNLIFQGSGNYITVSAIHLFGLHNFDFYILEYFPHLTYNINSYKALLKLEALYIKQINLENPENK